MSGKLCRNVNVLLQIYQPNCFDQSNHCWKCQIIEVIVTSACLRMPMKPQKQKVGLMATEGIASSNACTSCLYNIPRASLMLTIPGLVIFVSGAAMTAFADPGQWSTDGLAMVTLVCLILGGVWTLGGLVFWLIAWWRLKPKPEPKHRSNAVFAAHDNPAVQLETVISHPCDVSPETANHSTNSEQKSDVQANSEKTDIQETVISHVSPETANHSTDSEQKSDVQANSEKTDIQESVPANV